MFLQKLKVFFAVIHLLTTCYSLPLSPFYPYGVSNGDTALSPNDDGGSGKITLSTPFQYFGRYHSSLYVSTYYMPFFEVKSIFHKPWTEILAYFWLLLNSRWNRVLCMYVGGKRLFRFFFFNFWENLFIPFTQNVNWLHDCCYHLRRIMQLKRIQNRFAETVFLI